MCLIASQYLPKFVECGQITSFNHGAKSSAYICIHIIWHSIYTEFVYIICILARKCPFVTIKMRLSKYNLASNIYVYKVNAFLFAEICGDVHQSLVSQFAPFFGYGSILFAFSDHFMMSRVPKRFMLIPSQTSVGIIRFEQNFMKEVPILNLQVYRFPFSYLSIGESFTRLIISLIRFNRPINITR